MILPHDTEFAPSRVAEHYTPPPERKSRVGQIVMAVSCLSLFAAFGVVFALPFLK